MKDISDQEIIDDIRRVSHQLSTENLSRSEYLLRGKYSKYQLYDGGRSWDTLCQLAGINSKKKEAISDEIYFERLRKAVSQIGRLPKTNERKKFGLNFSKRRYPTLKTFIEKALEIGELDKVYSSDVTDQSKQVDIPQVIKEEKYSKPEAQVQRQVPPIPKSTRRNKWERTGIEGFPYAPQDELGVVALFAWLCSIGIIDWQILELRGGKGIDTTCFDNSNQREIHVELKYTHTKSNWNHKIEETDYVVCWENRWLDFPKPILVLKEIVRINFL